MDAKAFENPGIVDSAIRPALLVSKHGTVQLRAANVAEGHQMRRTIDLLAQALGGVAENIRVIVDDPRPTETPRQAA